MPRIRVLHIITRMIKGGAQENTLLTVVHLDKSRYDVDLVSGPSIGPEGEIETKARRLGVNLTVIPELIREIRLMPDLKALYKLYRFIKKGHYDIVHTHSSKAGLLGRLAAKWAGVPAIVHTPHSHIFYGYYGPLMSRIFAWIEKGVALITDRLLMLTPTEKEDHIKFGVAAPSKLTVVHSGVPLERFLNVNVDRASKRREWGLGEDDRVCICVARLEPIKGHEYLIAAVPEALRSVPNAKLVLVGDGELRKKLEALATDLGVRDAVVFTGLRDDTPELLAMSDVFALASINEGMGRVLVEAMAVGLPTVATDVGGVSTVVVDGKTGFLVPPENPHALAEAMVKLLKDAKLRSQMGEAGRKRVDPDFGVETMIDKITSVYEAMIAQKIPDKRRLDLQRADAS
jgi:glycosyltransferase involved in cell wall biosynthesis